jgi:hypothetical protein
MVLCPIDMQPCFKPTCRSGWCKRTQEQCIVACSDCGELFAGGFAWRICTGCVAQYWVTTHREKE